MINLIIGAITALLIFFFAFQNSQTVTVQFLNYTLNDIPLYLVVILSALAGIIFSFVISIPRSISAAVDMFNKDRKIKSTENTLEKATNKVKDLEAENTKLKNNSRKPSFMRQSVLDKPNFLQKIRDRLP